MDRTLAPTGSPHPHRPRTGLHGRCAAIGAIVLAGLALGLLDARADVTSSSSRPADAAASPSAAPAAAAPSTAPTTVPASERFVDAELAAAVERYETFVQHIVKGQVNEAEVMAIPPPKAGAAVNHRMLEAMGRVYAKRGVPRVLAGQVEGDSALLLLRVAPTTDASSPRLRRYLLLRQQGEWKMLGFSMLAFEEILDDADRAAFRTLVRWADVRERDFNAGD